MELAASLEDKEKAEKELEAFKHGTVEKMEEKPSNISYALSTSFAESELKSLQDQVSGLEEEKVSFKMHISLVQIKIYTFYSVLYRFYFVTCTIYLVWRSALREQN